MAGILQRKISTTPSILAQPHPPTNQPNNIKTKLAPTPIPPTIRRPPHLKHQLTPKLALATLTMAQLIQNNIAEQIH